MVSSPSKYCDAYICTGHNRIKSLYGCIYHHTHSPTVTTELGGGRFCEPASGGCLLKGFLFHALYYFRSLFNLYCKGYLAFRILDWWYASPVRNQWSVQVSMDLVVNFNFNIAVNSLLSSVISSHQLKTELSRVEKLSYRGRSGVSSTVLSLKSEAPAQLAQQLVVLRSTVFQINS